MPCRTDYMEPSDLEMEASRVCTLLDELDGRGFDKNNWGGYHHKVYSKPITKLQVDNFVEYLCRRLKEVDPTKYSLEMQIWWRDHQLADKARIERENLYEI